MDGFPQREILRWLAPAMLACAAWAGQQPDMVLSDFEGEGFGRWRTTGEAFGSGPVSGGARGVRGERYAYSKKSEEGDRATGALTSPSFAIQRRYIGFLIGGGNQKGKTCVNLKINGRTVMSSTGSNRSELKPKFWDVARFRGQFATLEIVDDATGNWGYISVDHIVMTDTKPAGSEFGGTGGGGIKVRWNLIPLGRKEVSEWTYTHQKPEADWKTPAFQPRGWKTGSTPFGGASSKDPARTDWTDSGLWIRRSFTAPANVVELRLFRAHDRSCTWFLNGTQVKRYSNKSGYSVDKHSGSLLQPGPNLLAVYVDGVNDQRFADFGLTAVVEMPRPATPLLPAGKHEEREWLYLIDKAPEGWASPRAGTQGWKRGSTPIGSKDLHDGVKMRVKIPASKEIYARTTFQVHRRPAALLAEIAHDDEAHIHINGRPVMEIGGYSEHRHHWVLLPPKAVASLQPGLNLVAVRVHNDSNDHYFDLGLWPIWDLGALRGTAPLREWTHMSGRKIKARFVALQGDQVQLQLENGTAATVPAAVLSPEDREFVGLPASTAAGPAAPAPTPPAPTQPTDPGDLPKDFRNWTVGFQQPMAAKLTKHTRLEVTLTDAQGKAHRVPVAFLGDEDLAYLRSLGEPPE